MNQESIDAFEKMRKHIFGIISETDSRLLLLEHKLNAVTDIISNKYNSTGDENDQSNYFANKSHHQQLSSTKTTNETQQSVLNIKENIEIKVVNLETKWVVKRHFPDFEVQIVDGTKIFPFTSGWNISLHLLSGHGVYVDHILSTNSSSSSSSSSRSSNSSSSSPIVFSLRHGRALISGLRFSAVSSRNGDHFNLEIRLHTNGTIEKTPMLITPNSQIKSWISPNILIRSERLVGDSKVPAISDLHADDLLTKVPGIGKTYTNNFAKLGILTVRDLAQFDTSPESREIRLQLLSSVRKDRGTLTEAKLASILREVKMVLKKETETTEEEQQYENEQEEEIDNDDENDNNDEYDDFDYNQHQQQKQQQDEQEQKHEEDIYNGFNDSLNQSQNHDLYNLFEDNSNQKNENNQNEEQDIDLDIDLQHAQTLLYNDIFSTLGNSPNMDFLFPDSLLPSFSLDNQDEEQPTKKQKLIDENIESNKYLVSNNTNSPSSFSSNDQSTNLSCSDRFLFSMVNFNGLEEDELETPTFLLSS